MSAPFGYICTQSPPTVGWLCQALGVWMLIEKAKIPKGTSFVLRSSVLLEALAAAGISVETSLQHMNSKIFFDAFFWPPRPNVQHERFYIRAGSVPASQARPAREFMESIVLPEFIQWAQDILALPRDSPVRRSEQVFAREFIGHTPGNSFKPDPLRGSA